MPASETASNGRNPASKRQVVSSPSVYEQRLGYARGVRVGNLVFIAGTAAIDGEGEVRGTDAYSQTEFIIEKIRTALAELGTRLEHVVSTVTHLSDPVHFDEYARAHRLHFGEIRPVNTTVIAALVRPELLVEITATAVVPD